MALKIDTYTFRARRLPPLIIALPVGIAAFAAFPDSAPWWSAFWGLFVWSGGSFLIAQFGRDAGKRKEPKLWESWGGAPTTQRLRHAGAANPLLVSHMHTRLAKQFPDLHFPTPEEEAADPVGADRLYEVVVSRLRERTRGNPLVFEENCSYGFRRNLWARKRLGIAAAAAAVALTGGMILRYLVLGVDVALPRVVAATVIALVLLVSWIFVINKAWIRIPADAYAERLLAVGAEEPSLQSERMKGQL